MTLVNMETGSLNKKESYMKQIICTLTLEDDFNGKINVITKEKDKEEGPNLHELELMIKYINKLKDLIYNEK